MHAICTFLTSSRYFQLHAGTVAYLICYCQKEWKNGILHRAVIGAMHRFLELLQGGRKLSTKWKGFAVYHLLRLMLDHPITRVSVIATSTTSSGVDCRKTRTLVPTGIPVTLISSPVTHPYYYTLARDHTRQPRTNQPNWHRQKHKKLNKLCRGRYCHAPCQIDSHFVPCERSEKKKTDLLCCVVAFCKNREKILKGIVVCSSFRVFGSWLISPVIYTAHYTVS